MRCSVQAFDADLLVADPGNLGGWALADALSIHKAIVQVPGFTPPLVRHKSRLGHISYCQALQQCVQAYVLKQT